MVFYRQFTDFDFLILTLINLFVGNVELKLILINFKLYYNVDHKPYINSEKAQANMCIRITLKFIQVYISLNAHFSYYDMLSLI